MQMKTPKPIRPVAPSVKARPPPIYIGATRILRAVLRECVEMGVAEFEGAPANAWLMDKKFRFLSGTFARLADKLAPHGFKKKKKPVRGMEILFDESRENVIMVLTGDESTGVPGAQPRFSQGRGRMFERLLARQMNLFEPTVAVHVLLVRHLPRQRVQYELLRVDGLSDTRTPIFDPAYRFIQRALPLNTTKATTGPSTQSAPAGTPPLAKRQTKVTKIVPKT